MTDPGHPGVRVRASRARRRAREHNRRRTELLVALVVAVGGIAYASTQLGDVAAGPGPSGPLPEAPAEAAGLAVLNVIGAQRPLLAVVGGREDRRSAALGIPFGLTFVVPGEGEARTLRVARLDGPSLQVAVSNLVGTWVDHYAVTDLERLERLVDQAGGLDVVLPGAVTVDEQVLGPGDANMTGGQVRAYLAAEDVNTFTRWEIVVAGLLASPPSLLRGDLTELDRLEDVQAVLEHARGAEVETLPIQIAATRLRIPDYEQLDAVMGRAFGVRRVPVPVIVQNGNGAPGLGELVGRRLIPRGFRVVLSQNAQRFDHERTQVVAFGEEHVAAARRARAALGVGRVAVTQVPSGIGDVIIVVGKDFTA